MSLVRRRIECMSDEDLSQQVWFVHASLATLSPAEDVPRGERHVPAEPRARVEREQLLRAARAAGDRLEALALRGEGNVSWVGLTATRLGQLKLAPLGTDLYDGLPGIALFLAYLGSVTGEDSYTELARRALATLRRQVEEIGPSITSVGAFAGWGGIIYTLTHLSRLWDEPSILEEAIEHARLLPALIEMDNQLDIIDGSAGCIGSLSGLYHCTDSQSILSIARQCGERLTASAQAMDRGVGWVIPSMGSRPLAGFAHGAAGIAYALLELAELTGEEQFRTTALAAISYERSVFSLEERNWPDLRERVSSVEVESDEGPSFPTAWCHGAPGIGLARLRSLQLLDDGETRDEIETALRTTLGHGFGGDHSLCHGDLGNLDVLQQATQTLGPAWQAPLDRMTAIVVESIDSLGWLCGNSLRVESPGLMTGLAGIGYELLRLAEPTRVPSVLALAPPATNR